MASGVSRKNHFSPKNSDPTRQVPLRCIVFQVATLAVTNNRYSVTNRNQGWDVGDAGKSIGGMEFLFVTGPDVNDGAPVLLL